MGRHFTIWIAAAGIAVVAAVGSAAQTMSVDDVVARNVAAKGGREKLKAVQTIKQTGLVQTGPANPNDPAMVGMQMGLTVFGKRPNMVRQEITVNEKLVISGFDGQVAWILNPLLGPQQTKPVILSGPQAEQIRAESHFDGPLVDYRSQGYSAAVDQPETTADGRRLIHLRLTAANGRVTRIYLDSTTWLDVKHVSVAEQMRLEQHFDDYRAVEGFTVPFRIRMLVNGVQQSEIRVQKVEFNTTMDDVLFRLPK